MTLASFDMPFLVTAAIGSLSVLAVWPMRKDAGDALRGRDRPAEIDRPEENRASANM